MRTARGSYNADAFGYPVGRNVAINTTIAGVWQPKHQPDTALILARKSLNRFGARAPYRPPRALRYWRRFTRIAASLAKFSAITGPAYFSPA